MTVVADIMATPQTTFSDLPNELVQSILFYLPPEFLCPIRAVNKRLLSISDTPLLWRYHCRTQYRFWDPSHDITNAFAKPVDATDWKGILVERRRLDRLVGERLDEVVKTGKERIANIEAISKSSHAGGKGQHTYDVKDALLRHCQTPEETEDYLARRYWAKAALERLHRGLAIEQWRQLRHQRVSIEKALGSFDMFVAGPGDGDYNDIHHDLDSLATTLLAQYPSFSELSARKKALTLAEFLRSQSFTGVESEKDYHNLQNNFISRVLRNPKHEALPPICVAIYCCIASRVGLLARPCGFPLHVYAVVSPPEGRDLDNKPDASENAPDRLYIDAFRPTVDIPVSQLKSELRRLGVSAHGEELYLGPSSTLEITLRTARNIMKSVQIIQDDAHHAGIADNGLRTPAWATTTPDVDSAFYATLWSTCLLHDYSSSGNERRRQYIPYILEHFQQHSPWDVSLIESHILPLFYGFPEYGKLREMIWEIRQGDKQERGVVRRDAKTRESVVYSVGQVFRHKRYGYEGVIVGWDTCCDAGETWINQMGVDELGRGRTQSFYHVL
jgi:F-box protein 21